VRLFALGTDRLVELWMGTKTTQTASSLHGHVGDDQAIAMATIVVESLWFERRRWWIAAAAVMDGEGAGLARESVGVGGVAGS
jgi:hypothetical protein